MILQGCRSTVIDSLTNPMPHPCQASGVSQTAQSIVVNWGRRGELTKVDGLRRSCGCHGRPAVSVPRRSGRPVARRDRLRGRPAPRPRGALRLRQEPTLDGSEFLFAQATLPPELPQVLQQFLGTVGRTRILTIPRTQAMRRPRQTQYCNHQANPGPPGLIQQIPDGFRRSRRHYLPHWFLRRRSCLPRDRLSADSACETRCGSARPAVALRSAPPRGCQPYNAAVQESHGGAPPKAAAESGPPRQCRPGEAVSERSNAVGPPPPRTSGQRSGATAAHSTVTLLARFRGRSTLQPRCTAM